MADDTPKTGAPAPPPGPAPLSPARRRGRRVATFLYYAVVGGIAVAAAVELSLQVFAPARPAGPAPFSSCGDGLRLLYHAVENARATAERPEALGLDDDEDAALDRYRDALEPSWRHHDTVAALCRSEPAYRATLDAIERLRYSEEHGVRHQAVELTMLRRHVRKLVERRLAPIPPAAGQN